MTLVFAGVCSHAPGITGRADRAKSEHVDAIHGGFRRLRQAIEEIDPEIRKVLLLWFKHNRSGFLLADKKGRALGSNGITKSLAKVGLQRLQKRLG